MRLLLRMIALLALAALPVLATNDAPERTGDEAPLKRLDTLPFRSGEKIHYTIRWGIFTVGRATMEYVGPVKREGEDNWQVILTARTNSFADAIFKVRDWNAVWVDKDFTRPLYYEKRQNEGSTHRDVIVTFDWEKNKAQYSDRGKFREPIDIVPGSWDPLGITYAVRALDLAGVTHLSVPSTDGKKNVTTEIAVSGPVKVKVPAGRFEALLLSPNTKDLGGVFRKSDKAGISLWFSNDERHLPIRMASKVIVGSFVAEMTRVEYSQEEGEAPEKPEVPEGPEAPDDAE